MLLEKAKLHSIIGAIAATVLLELYITQVSEITPDFITFLCYHMAHDGNQYISLL